MESFGGCKEVLGVDEMIKRGEKKWGLGLELKGKLFFFNGYIYF